MSPAATARNFTPTKVLRRRAHQPFSAFGAHFLVYDLPDGWSAVAYTSGHPNVPSLRMRNVDLTRDYWKEALGFIHDCLSDTAVKRLHKRSQTAEVSELHIDWPSNGKLGIICKQGYVDSVSQKLGTGFKGPKEWREFWRGHQLLQVGFPTPMPLACMWRRAGVWHLQGRLITEFITDALPLDRAVRKIEARRRHVRSRADSLNALTRKLVEVVGRLGRQGLYHRDLKVSNILVSNWESDPQPWLIDLDGIECEAQPRGPRLERSLQRLVSSLRASTDLGSAQYLRALKELLKTWQQPEAQWKSAWIEIRDGVDRLSRKQYHRRKHKQD